MCICNAYFALFAHIYLFIPFFYYIFSGLINILLDRMYGNCFRGRLRKTRVSISRHYEVTRKEMRDRRKGEEGRRHVKIGRTVSSYLWKGEEVKDEEAGGQGRQVVTERESYLRYEFFPFFPSPTSASSLPTRTS